MQFSAPQWDILKSTKSLNLFLAGKGSGKSHLAGILSASFITEYPHCRGFIAANTYDQVNTSTLVRVFAVWKELGVEEYTDQNTKGCYVIGKQPPRKFKQSEDKYINYSNIISFANGCTIYIGSLENAKSHEGKEFAWCILDETKDSRENDVKDTILTRLRQKGLIINGKEINPLYVLTSPAKVDWINKWFELDKHIEDINAHIYSDTDYYRLETANKMVVISSTYHNMHHLPENYFAVLRESNSDEKFNTIVYANPFGRAGGEYYPSFERKKHVQKAEYDPALPLHLSFDFNYVPYNPAGLFQIMSIDNIWHVYMVDEFALTSPGNSVEHVCDAVLARYRQHKSGWFIYGDATGKAGSIEGKEQRSKWDRVRKAFHYLTTVSSWRVPRGNKHNDTRRDFCNRVFEDKLPLRIHIGEDCKHMINDFMYCKEDKEGGKDKKTVKDGNGQSYQPYGHFGDLYEYFLLQCFAFLDKKV
jgi:hypothetical protein